MSETEIMTKNKLMKKYSDLVWLARSTNDTSEIVTLRQEVRDLYPKETAEFGAVALQLARDTRSR